MIILFYTPGLIESRNETIASFISQHPKCWVLVSNILSWVLVPNILSVGFFRGTVKTNEISYFWQCQGCRPGVQSRMIGFLSTAS